MATTEQIDPRVYNTARGIAHEALRKARDELNAIRLESVDNADSRKNYALLIWGAENKVEAARWLWEQAQAHCTFK